MKPTILVLDDNPRHLKAIVTCLQETTAAEIVGFDLSKAAIEAIRGSERDFDAFVLDVEMEGQRLSGIDVAECIRRIPKYTTKPIIFLSSYAHFSYGALRYIHYYEFVHKGCDVEQLVSCLRTALFPAETRCMKRPVVYVKVRRFMLEFDAENISYIELRKRELTMVDLLGKVERFIVNPNTFLDICNQLSTSNMEHLQQVHRTIIINTKRIKSIEWQKNTATVQLFNVNEKLPAGKTYLRKLDIYKK